MMRANRTRSVRQSCIPKITGWVGVLVISLVSAALLTFVPTSPPGAPLQYAGADSVSMWERMILRTVIFLIGGLTAYAIALWLNSQSGANLRNAITNSLIGNVGVGSFGMTWPLFALGPYIQGNALAGTVLTSAILTWITSNQRRQLREDAGMVADASTIASVGEATLGEQATE